MFGVSEHTKHILCWSFDAFRIFQLFTPTSPLKKQCFNSISLRDHHTPPLVHSSFIFYNNIPYVIRVMFTISQLLPIPVVMLSNKRSTDSAGWTNMQIRARKKMKHLDCEFKFFSLMLQCHRRRPFSVVPLVVFASSPWFLLWPFSFLFIYPVYLSSTNSFLSLSDSGMSSRPCLPTLLFLPLM